MRRGWAGVVLAGVSGRAWAHDGRGLDADIERLLDQPAQVLALLAIGLLAAQQSLRSRTSGGTRPHELIGLAVGLLAGWAHCVASGPLDLGRFLLVLTVALAGNVSAAWGQPAWMRLLLAAVVGLGVGKGAADLITPGGPYVAIAWLLCAGLALALGAVLQRWRHPTLQIGLRVLAAWLGACALLMAALVWRDGH